MNREDIIRMAREAATEDGSVKRSDGKNIVIYAAKTSLFLERFAALVAEHEREECAKVCDAVDRLIGAIEGVGMQGGARKVLTKACEDAASAVAVIRARGHE